MRHIAWLGLVVAVAAASTGCGGSTTATAREDAGVDARARGCVPGQSVACTGVGGCSGGQVCNATGTAFGPCDCGGSESDSGSRKDVGASKDSAPEDAWKGGADVYKGPGGPDAHVGDDARVDANAGDGARVDVHVVEDARADTHVGCTPDRPGATTSPVPGA